MGILDFFRSKPETPRERKAPVVSRRSYAAAGNKAYFGSFNQSGGSADYELSIGLKPARDRIRAMARNSSTMHRYVQLMKDNVVGDHGFTLRVRVPVGAAGRMNETLNDNVEKAWAAFCERPTACQTMRMTQLEKLIVGSWARDGEKILEIVRGPSWSDGVVFHPLEADMLDEGLNTIYPATGNRVRMGVELDAYDRPVAYHLLNQHPGDVSWVSPDSRKRYRRVPANRIIHVFEKLRPGQTRGEPPAVTVVNTMRMLDGYREAEVTARRIKASTMGFFTEDQHAEAREGLDGLADRTVEGDAGEEFQMDMEPGLLKKLPRGYGFTAFDPGGTQTDYADFEGQIKTDASQGLNISPVSLGYETNGLSYSTHRGIIAEDRDYYRGLQGFFIDMAMTRIFAVWLSSHISFNTSSAIPPSKTLAILANFTFMGRGWEYIDPSKDAKADVEMLKARTTSLSRIAAKRGLSVDDLLREIKSDEDALKRYGLTQDLGDGNNNQTISGGDDEEEQ